MTDLSVLAEPEVRAQFEQLDPLYRLSWAWRAKWLKKAHKHQILPHGDWWSIWLLLAGRGAGKTRTAAEQIKARHPGAQIACVSVDVTSHPAVVQATAQTVAIAPVDALVNCAGIVHGERVVGKEGPHALASFSKVITINLIGSFNMIRLAATAMCKGTPNASAYSASKAGVIALTKSLGKELAETGIRVHALAPAAIETELLSQNLFQPVL